MIMPRFINVGLFMIVCILLSTGSCRADIPTPEQKCRIRNFAVCQNNGVQFLVESDCSSTAQAIYPAGQERCNGVLGNSNISVWLQLEQKLVKPVQLAPGQDRA